MSSENKNFFTKENLDTYLKELAKEFKRINGRNMEAEIILIGGAAILANYGFRNMTTDVDAIIHAASSMKDAINRVGDKYDLPNGWLNTDFMRTGSYSPKLVEFSVHYRMYSNVLEIRTIASEYLIAMKLRSGRKYKNDLSDIIGILAEHEKRNQPITLEMIDRAVTELYGGWTDFPENSKSFIEDAIKKGNYKEVYISTNEEEKLSKNMLVEFEGKYPGVANQSNINDILKKLKKKNKDNQER